MADLCKETRHQRLSVRTVHLYGESDDAGRTYGTQLG